MCKFAAIYSLAITVGMFAFGALASSLAEENDPTAVFQQRLMPIFKSENPSSCVQCHLSSVDLKDYILPSSRETFLSLRDQGLVDVERPQDSKILHLISMGESDPDALSQRIHAKTRNLEYEAFASWIDACCRDPDLLAAKASADNDKAGPSASDAVIRHNRKDRVLDSFVRHVWSQRMRCFPCHTPAELDEDNPMHAKPIQRHKDFVAKYGTRMNIFKESPNETMQSLIGSSQNQNGDQLPLINLTRPSESLLLLKPTAKLPSKDQNGKLAQPSSQIPVSHMGGIKMHKDDFSYKAFSAWLQDFANATSGSYSTAKALPSDNWYPTKHVVRIKGLPDDWPKLSTAQIFVHRWDGERDAWGETPVAFTQSKVTPRKMINGSLFVLARKDTRDGLDPISESLSPGQVQWRVYLDRDNRVASDPTLLLNTREPDATAVTMARFGMGFKEADLVEAADVEFFR